MRTRIFFFAAATSLVLLILLPGGALAREPTRRRFGEWFRTRLALL